MNRGAARSPAVISETYLYFMAFAGAGLATLPLGQPARMAVLLAILAGMAVVYRMSHVIEGGFSPRSLGRGALLGLVISVPVLAVLPAPLRQFNERLYGTSDAVMLFYQTCLVAAPLEELFFRGIVATGEGSSASVGLYAALGLIYFAPHAPLLAVAAVVLAYGVLGIVYTYVHENHGLAAAVACHAVAAFVLNVAPSLLGALRAILA